MSNDTDQKWIDALKPYLGGGIIPFFTTADGQVDAVKTIDHFAMLKGIHKIDENGNEIP